MRTFFFIILLIPLTVWSQDSTSAKMVVPQDLERLDTVYNFEPGRTYPSCAIFKHRRVEREKVLRELKHSLDKEDKAVLVLSKDSFITNQFFLDERLWNDDTVIITSRWQMPAGLVAELSDRPKDVYFWLSGDGVDWREHMAFFPEDVSFEYDLSSGILVSTHRAYYVDYCSPSKKSSLQWYPHFTIEKGN